MLVTANDAIILDVKVNTFKGKDGKEVSYSQAQIIDDDNNFHKVTVPSDFNWDGVEPAHIHRMATSLVLDIQEQDNKLKKRLASIG